MESYRYIIVDFQGEIKMLKISGNYYAIDPKYEEEFKEIIKKISSPT